MNRTMKTLLILLTFWMTFTLAVPAQDARGQSQPFLSVETDPATFAFGGYALHLRGAPAASSHWVFGLGAYAMNFPNLFVDVNPKNRDEGWEVRLQRGWGFFTEYYFDPRRRGWYVGGQLAAQRFHVRNEAAPDEKGRFTNVLIMGQAGYRWYPFASHTLYVQPWAGLGYTSPVSGDRRAGGERYDVAPIIPFLTVHLGYEF